MKRKIDKYLQEPYSRLLISNGDGTFTAEMLEFAGCIADGETANEAIENLDKAAKTWIKSCLERDKEIPEPLSGYDYSGRIALRLPISLHRQAVQLSQREGTSLNQFLVAAVSAYIEANNLVNKVVQAIKSFSNAGVHLQIHMPSALESTAQTTIVTFPWLPEPMKMLPVGTVSSLEGTKELKESINA